MERRIGVTEFCPTIGILASDGLATYTIKIYIDNL
jgi:hypothetical protein